jgi:Flp pilus assembly protein TadD
LKQSLRVDADFADAHELLGNLLLAKGQARDAVSHYREALRIAPDSARSHLGLGAALAAAGDPTGAVPHLQRAAASTDAGIREQAQQFLRKLGRE